MHYEYSNINLCGVFNDIKGFALKMTEIVSLKLYQPDGNANGCNAAIYKC